MALDGIVAKLKADIVYVASLADGKNWKELEEIYYHKTGIAGPEFGIMSAYRIGEKDSDKKVVKAAKRVLQVKIPDLEERLPWYDLMYGILEKGKLKDETDEDIMRAGPWSFQLEPNVHRLLAKDLAEKTELSLDEALHTVNSFAGKMGYIPGSQYWAEKTDFHPQTHPDGKIIQICRFLHLPLSYLWTIENEETVADFYYETRDLSDSNSKLRSTWQAGL